MEATTSGGDVALAVLVGLACFGFFLLLIFGVPLFLITLGFRLRRTAEQQLARDEPRLHHLLTTNMADTSGAAAVTLVSGSVAYAADSPSRWVSAWRNLVGGRMKSLTHQADLARRIAIVRMLEEAERLGASHVANLRLDTCEIASGLRNNSMMVVEMLASGTAVLPPPR